MPHAVRAETAPISQETAAAKDLRDGEPDEADYVELKTLLANLSKDPSLRYNERGRELLRVLFAQAGGLEACQNLVDDMPPHCTYLVVQVARVCANEWLDLATHLQQQLPAA